MNVIWLHLKSLFRLGWNPPRTSSWAQQELGAQCPENRAWRDDGSSLEATCVPWGGPTFTEPGLGKVPLLAQRGQDFGSNVGPWSRAMPLTVGLHLAHREGCVTLSRRWRASEPWWTMRLLAFSLPSNVPPCSCACRWQGDSAQGHQSSWAGGGCGTVTPDKRPEARQETLLIGD